MPNGAMIAASATAAVDMGKKMGVELPIITSVNEVLFNDKDAREAINALMNRPPQEEMGWMESIEQKGGQ